MKRFVTNQKGFSLVELLIAITVFAVGLLAVSGMQITAIKGNSKASSVAAASSLALSVLEEFMVLSAGSAIVTTDQAVPASWSADKTLSGAGTYDITYTVQTNNPINNVARISVTVSGGSLLNPVTMVGFKRIL